MSWRSNGESEHEISALGSFPGRVGAWISTASVSAPVLPGAERPEDRVVGRVVRCRARLRDSTTQSRRAVTTSGSLQPLGELEQRVDRGGDRGRVLQLVLDAATDADDLFLRGAGEHVGTRALDRAEERAEVAGDRVQVAGQVRRASRCRDRPRADRDRRATCRPRSSIAVDDEPSAPACPCRFCAALRSRSAFCVSVDATSRVWVTNFGSLFRSKPTARSSIGSSMRPNSLALMPVEELARR